MMGTRISTGGWITFAILLAFCWPLFWIGLLSRSHIPDAHVAAADTVDNKKGRW